MTHTHLAVYLHDHLSGSTGAITLLEQLTTEFTDALTQTVLQRLKREFAKERQQLMRLTEAFPLPSALPRRFAAWLGEKGLEAKLAIDAGGQDQFRLFEGLEALSVGIAGKRLLWRLLAREQQRIPALMGPPYTQLINQAISQRLAIEPLRLKAGHLAVQG